MRRHLGLIVILLAAVAVSVVARHRYCSRQPRPSPSPEQVKPAPALTVEHVQFTSAGEFDPGTLRILLRNSNDFPVRLTEMAWDGLPLPAFGIDLDWRKMPPRSAGADKARKAGTGPTGDHAGSGESPSSKAEARNVRRAMVPGSLLRAAYWSRVEPGGMISPGGVAMITVKATTDPHRRFGIVLSGVTSRDQTRSQMLVSFFVDPVPGQISIARVAFADDGRKAFVYVRNDGDAPRAITRLEMDGQPCTDGLWLPQKDLPAGGHAIAGFTPAKPFERGEFVTARVVTDGGSAIAQVRAFWGFPMGVESGAAPAEWGLDPATRVWHPAFLGVDHPRLPAPDRTAHALGGINAMTCVICGLGQLDTIYDTAQEMLRRYEVARHTLPGVPVIVNPCRVEPERGYALFAPTADALLVNPSVPTSLTPAVRRTPSPTSTVETTIAIVAHLARAGRAASEPALYWPLLSTGKVFGGPQATGGITPAEFRARLYTLLAEGADGLFYRHNWAEAQAKNPALNEAVREINQEVKALLPWLAVGGVRGEARVEGPPSLTASTRSAGDRGMLVFLMRKDAGSSPVGKDADQDTADAAMARVTVPVPAWAKVADVSQARPEELAPVTGAVVEDGVVSFSVPIPEGGAGYAITYEAP